MRAQLASATTRAVNAASRRLGRGQGTVAGGRAGLRLDPELLEHLSAGRQVALVTGTNGKTTTTRLLTVGLGATGDAVVSNETGSNMPPGHVAALAGRTRRAPCSRWTRSTCPACWRRRRQRSGRAAEPVAGPARPDQRGAHDGRPLAGRAGGGAAHPRRGERRRSAGGVGGRRGTRRALGGCRPALAARCRRAARRARAASRSRTTAGRARAAASPVPTPRRRSWSRRTARRAADVGRRPDRRRPARAAGPVQPGQRADGGRGRGGVRRRRRSTALDAMESVQEVAGRFTVRAFGDVRARLMLAKNPAGWDELLDLVAGRTRRSSSASTRGWPTGRTPAGCGTCPSSAWPAAPWWRPATASATCRCACTTAGCATAPRPSPCGPSPRRVRQPAASVDAGDGSSTSSATTPPSTTCLGAPA